MVENTICLLPCWPSLEHLFFYIFGIYSPFSCFILNFREIHVDAFALFQVLVLCHRFVRLCSKQCSLYDQTRQGEVIGWPAASRILADCMVIQFAHLRWNLLKLVFWDVCYCCVHFVFNCNFVNVPLLQCYSSFVRLMQKIDPLFDTLHELLGMYNATQTACQVPWNF